MFIPVHFRLPRETFTATLKGSELKRVRCESCEVEYIYEMRRSARGVGESVLGLDDEGAQKRAFADAERDLLHELRCGCDPVPCPACGWYQKEMIPRARGLRRQRMGTIGIVLLIAGLISVIVAFVICLFANPAFGPHPIVLLIFPAAGACAALGIALLILRVILNSHYDPNMEDVDARIRLGQDRALLKEEYEKMTSDNAGIDPLQV